MNMDAMQKELDYEIFVMEIPEMDLCSKIIRRRLTMLHEGKKEYEYYLICTRNAERGKKHHDSPPSAFWKHGNLGSS